VGEIRPPGKNASENLIRRTFNRVTFRSIIGSRYCPGILLAGLQAGVAAIIFSPASSPDVVNFARESEALLIGYAVPSAPKNSGDLHCGNAGPVSGRNSQSFCGVERKGAGRPGRDHRILSEKYGHMQIPLKTIFRNYLVLLEEIRGRRKNGNRPESQQSIVELL